MWERGLKLLNKALELGTLVAPHVGAWIETALFAAFADDTPSLPMWERGLKLVIIL